MLGTSGNKAYEKNYESPTGGKFTIKADTSGLFTILMNNGGIAPKFTFDRFTSFTKAEKTLLKYFTTKAPAKAAKE